MNDIKSTQFKKTVRNGSSLQSHGEGGAWGYWCGGVKFYGWVSIYLSISLFILFISLSIYSVLCKNYVISKHINITGALWEYYFRDFLTGYAAET